MTVSRYVLDTNVVTALLRKEGAATRRVQEALALNAEFLMCPVVYYEIHRGLLYRDAKRQLGFFLRFTSQFTWDDLDRVDWERAAQLWANLRRIGRPRGNDADLLIGAFAVRRNAIVASDNTKHFRHLGVPVENWRRD